ncbi:hypothetical protein CFI03_021495 [Paenibacillus sp. ATY16]|nr:hypothetical protein [Paenibacillus sp. ATY16]
MGMLFIIRVHYFSQIRLNMLVVILITRKDASTKREERMMSLRVLFEYMVEKLMAKLNQPLKGNSEQTIGDLIYDSSIYMDGDC